VKIAKRDGSQPEGKRGRNRSTKIKDYEPAGSRKVFGKEGKGSGSARAKTSIGGLRI